MKDKLIGIVIIVAVIGWFVTLYQAVMYNSVKLLVELLIFPLGMAHGVNTMIKALYHIIVG